MRARLIAAFVSLILVMLFVQDIPLIQYLDRVERNQLLTSLERDAWQLAAENDADLVAGSTSDFVQDASEYHKATGANVILTDSNGTIVASTVPGDVGSDFSNRPEIADALRNRPTTGQRFSSTLLYDIVYVAVPVVTRGELIGVIRLSYPVSEIEALVQDRTRGVIFVAGFTVLISIFAALLIANIFTRRLRRLRRATSELASGDLTVRVSDPNPQGAPEIVQLEQAFDAMVERMAQLIESQKSFASDASHQLRTPLAALRLQLDNAAGQTDDPVEVAARIAAATAEVLRLQLLVDGLLALARIEGSSTNLQPIKLDRLLADRIEMWRPLADERGVRVHAEVTPGLAALAAPSAIDQIVDAYLDNALEVAPVGSVIRLSAVADNAHVLIEVSDQGPGMSSEDMERAFDRFWRGRSDNTGTGLGLAIVHRLATAMGAQVGLRSAPGGGVTAYLRLPAA